MVRAIKNSTDHAAKSTPMSSSSPDTHAVKYLGTLALKSSHPAVKKLRRDGHEPSIHGNKVWRSSFVLMNYLKSHPLPRGAKVIDAGCGWGLTGIYLAKRFEAQVTGIDADADVAPFLAVQAIVNGVEIDFQRKKFHQIRKQDLAGVHTIIGADICFWDELVTPLFRLISRAMGAGVEQVLIADPGRTPFWELGKRCEATFNATTIERRISKPYSTSKHILVVKPD
jgi:predicted nicotinamide N-methyase